MKKIAIIDYGAGNLFSVRAALKRGGLSDDAIFFTQNPAELSTATHIILPGVGAFADCITSLKAHDGMIAAMEREIFTNYKPFLGICVGMQMLFEYGNEHGRHAGLGWLAGEVVKLEASDGIKIPHMGWNELHNIRPHALLKGVQGGDDAYFVHSYHAKCTKSEDILATAEYGGTIAAVVGRNNIFGVQFHPEKSHKIGAIILDNFLNMG